MSQVLSKEFFIDLGTRLSTTLPNREGQTFSEDMERTIRLAEERDYHASAESIYEGGRVLARQYKSLVEGKLSSDAHNSLAEMSKVMNLAVLEILRMKGVNISS